MVHILPMSSFDTIDFNVIRRVYVPNSTQRTGAGTSEKLRTVSVTFIPRRPARLCSTVSWTVDRSGNPDAELKDICSTIEVSCQHDGVGNGLLGNAAKSECLFLKYKGLDYSGKHEDGNGRTKFQECASRATATLTPIS